MGLGISEAELRKVDHNSGGRNQPHSVSSYADILVMGSSFVTELFADTCCFSLVHISCLSNSVVICFVFLCGLGMYTTWVKLRAFSYAGTIPCCFSVHCSVGFSTSESCTQKKPSDWLLLAVVLQGKPNTTFYVDRKMEVFIQEWIAIYAKLGMHPLHVGSSNLNCL